MSLRKKSEEEEEEYAPEPSCVSVKSEVSMNYPPQFSDGAVTSDPEWV